MTISNIITSPALAGMRALRQWIVYMVAPDSKRPGKLTKIPVHHVTALPCSVVDPANWTDAATAATAAQLFGTSFGMGFCFTEGDPYWFLDIDGALQPDGQWSAVAQQLCGAFAGAAVEISASGKGLHLFGRGAVPPHASKNIEHHLEFYTEARFCALTGTALQGNCDTDHAAAVAGAVQAYFPPRVQAQAAPADGPRADWCGPTDDDELLRRALRSHSAAAVFGGKATFADLWDRNVAVLAGAYRGDGESGVDWSSADAALASHLAFWTGADAERIERLMRRSAMVREKWEREDYLPRTIQAACSMQQDVLQDKPVTAPSAPTDPAPAAPTMTARGEATFLSPAQQVELFKGCVYVADLHRVLVPGGKLYKPEQFKAVFGGRVFSLDLRNEKTTRNAFEAFTESQAFAAPVADGTSFWPKLPPGEISNEDGRRLVNTWSPPEPRRVKGDPSRFLRHLELLLPDEGDRLCLLYFVANLVQRPGEKFGWAPVIQGAEGNGKSFLFDCLRRTLGARYAYTPRAEQLGRAQFNQWLAGRVAILVDELGTKGDEAILEILKPLITDGRLELEGKGMDQQMADVCANWLFTTNHRNAIRKTGNDRRYAILWCAQQSAEDLQRDGLTERYFNDQWGWAHGDGFPIIADYLLSMQIPDEFGLRWAKGRAPLTTATAGAIDATRNPTEQTILDAIEDEAAGFRGGWVSSLAVRKRLELVRLPAGRLADWPGALHRLGFVQHPALGQAGQVHNHVLPDRGKPRLFVRRDSNLTLLSRPAEVAAAYSAAQGVVGAAAR